MTTPHPPTARQAQRSTATVPEMLAGARWTALVYALHLTPRESDVFRCILIDERVSAIAHELRLSEATVHTYRERLFRKLDVRSCAQAIAKAFATYVELSGGASLGHG